MGKYTPEPWWSARDPSHFHSLSSIVGGDSRLGTIRSVAEVTGVDIDEQEANTQRIVSCVNALAGIDDPQAFVQKVRDAVEAGAIDELYLSFLREHLKESPRG